MGEVSAESDDENSEEGQWGKRKHSYYNTDYVDSEIIDSDDEALEEEAEALRQQKKLRQGQTDDEFFDTFSTLLANPASEVTSRKVTQLAPDSDVSFLDNLNAESAERITRDLSGLSKHEKLEVDSQSIPCAHWSDHRQ